MVDILLHETVPKHEILNSKLKAELFKKFDIKEGKLPKIFETDPVVKAIEAKTGDVLKITRMSRTAGETVYYRLVVSKK